MRAEKIEQSRKVRRRGFTLPEVLVTIALVAVLAAVVVPTIANQVKKGDANRVAQDATDIRGAIEQFLSDVRKYPASIAQLTNPITTSLKPLQTTGTAPSNYIAADVARWKGPYLTKDSIATANTGFGWIIQDAFVVDTFPATGTTSPNGFGAGVPAYVNGKMFLTLRVCPSLSGVSCLYSATSKIDSLSWLAFEQQFDDANALSGTVRFTSDTGIVKILAMPIQP